MMTGFKAALLHEIDYLERYIEDLETLALEHPKAQRCSWCERVFQSDIPSDEPCCLYCAEVLDHAEAGNRQPTVLEFKRGRA